MRRRSVSVDISALPSSQEAQKKKKRVLKAVSKSTKDTKILEAAFKGNTKEITSLLKKGASIHSTDEGTGEHPLHLACVGNQPEAVTVLLDKSANPNLPSGDGSTPAHLCCSYGHVAALRALLAPPDFTKETNRSFAARKLELTAADKAGGTPLTNAITHGHMDCVQVLLRYDPKLASFVDMNSETPLHVACSLDGWKAIPLLLEATCDVNAKNHYDNTPLHIAAQCGNIACVVALLANGADCAALNRHKKTPLMVAQQAQHFDVVGVLRSKEEVAAERSPQPQMRRQTSAASTLQVPGGAPPRRGTNPPPPGSSMSMSSLPLPPPPSATLAPGEDGVSLAASLPSLPAPPSASLGISVNNISHTLPGSLPPPPTGLAPADAGDGAPPTRGRLRGRGRGGRGRGGGPSRAEILQGSSAPSLSLPVPERAQPPSRSAREYRSSKKSPRETPAPPLPNEPPPPLASRSTPNVGGDGVMRTTAPPSSLPATARGRGRGARGGARGGSRRDSLQRRKSAPMLIDKDLLNAAALPPPLAAPPPTAAIPPPGRPAPAVPPRNAR